ncbi:hypothetical protein DY000_02053611 [Brassica cretica]|uniref:Uncharacterized protein n=1 Tax=Brassica cretica TaxID=69181 RepID=A0ABQ7AGC0_BRACR|nr:hypothetical protein DY000_02053611 [Brassica cretica]
MKGLILIPEDEVFSFELTELPGALLQLLTSPSGFGLRREALDSAGMGSPYIIVDKSVGQVRLFHIRKYGRIALSRKLPFCPKAGPEAGGLQPPDHLSSDLLHYADDPPGHAGFQSCPDLELVLQPCFAAQYRSMSEVECRLMSDYLSPDIRPQLSRVGPEKVSIDFNNGVSIDTPFSTSIDANNELPIDVPSRERYGRV